MISKKKLMAIIDYELERKGITKSEVAVQLGVSKGTVSNLFNLKHKVGYMKFIELTRIAFGKYHHEYIEMFCKDSQEKVEREALEWAYSNSNMKVLKILLERATFKVKVNPIISVYELQMMRMEKKISIQDFFDQIENLTYTDPKNMDLATVILLGISTVYHYVDVAAYKAVAFKANNLLKQIQNIESAYLRMAYSLRVKVALIISSMKSNNLKLAKSIGDDLTNKETLEMFPLYFNNALVCLSEIFVFSNKRKSFSYIHHSVTLMNGGYFSENPKWQKIIKSTYDFVHIYHNDFNNLFLEDPAEMAHYLAKQSTPSEKEKAIAILDELERKNGYLTNFQTYYRALALESNRMMAAAKDQFYQSGDFFYAQLAGNLIENSN
ncbi:AimR family lysis-lysogeny pheromone receptor [Priestia flexa]|uniref:AimR family lysis-lysogeny pheromone receptor n=1 Tax=Priestia flexa TaxID=86664 RepID=UPI002490F025|nr:AimR family lysis-lysogeny pheromone receptor [Priestia flexa]